MRAASALLGVAGALAAPGAAARVAPEPFLAAPFRGAGPPGMSERSDPGVSVAEGSGMGGGVVGAEPSRSAGATSS